MTSREQELPELDALLREAGARKADVSADLLARVLQDAYEAQAAVGDAISTSPSPRARRETSLAAKALAWLHNFGAAGAGLATAGLAGLWLGFAPPALLAAPVEAVTAVLQGQEAGAEDAEAMEIVDLVPSFDSWLAEG